MTELLEFVADVHKCQLCAKSIDRGIKKNSPLKISLIKDIKSSPSLVPLFCFPSSH